MNDQPESAAWIKAIKSTPLQQRALVAICKAIFEDDDLDGGLKVLRTDPDAAWRSDTLAMLAEDTREEPSASAVAEIRSLGDPSEMNPYLTRPATSDALIRSKNNMLDPQSTVPTSPPVDVPYGKPVDFQSVFQQSQSK